VVDRPRRSGAGGASQAGWDVCARREIPWSGTVQITQARRSERAGARQSVARVIEGVMDDQIRRSGPESASGQQPRTERHPFFGGSFATFVASVVVAVTACASNGWLGSGDVPVFLVWSLPFALIVGLIARFLVARLGEGASLRRLVATLLGGGALGVGATITNAVVLGPWFGAWSIPVGLAWLLGGAIGLATGTTMRSGRNNSSTALALVRRAGPDDAPAPARLGVARLVLGARKRFARHRHLGTGG
jgi:hypothetical protein